MSEKMIPPAESLSLATPEILQSGFLSPLNSMGILVLSGEDAFDFAHGQFCQDVTRMPENTARLGGYCTPQGRLLASFLFWKSAAHELSLLLPREIIPALQKRLQMYVLRAKVSIKNDSEGIRLYGLGGKAAEKYLRTCLPSLPEAIGERQTDNSGTLIRLADAFGMPRYLWAENSNLVHTNILVRESGLKMVSEENWALCEINSGIAWIVQATQDKFIPQMLNLDVTDGMSFNKGCYPGQEVIARSQYRGQLKSRMLLAELPIQGDGTAGETGILPGMEVYPEEDPTQACGVIVNAARRDRETIECLVVIQADYSTSHQVYVGSLQGKKLLFKALPYALPDSFSGLIA